MPNEVSQTGTYGGGGSTDTLYWDNGTTDENPPLPARNPQKSSANSCTQYQQPAAPIYTRYGHPHPAQVQPVRVQHFHHPQFIQQKPKSWDNLAAAKTNPSYCYGYLDFAGGKVCTGTSPECRSQVLQQRHSMPRKQAGYGSSAADRYSFVENYAPPPLQYLQETTTITTTITTKSTENLIGACYTGAGESGTASCACIYKNGIGGIDNVGYYSKVSRNENIPAVSEVTRL